MSKDSGSTFLCSLWAVEASLKIGVAACRLLMAAVKAKKSFCLEALLLSHLSLQG